MRLVVAPSTGRTHRYHTEYVGRTACGLTIPDRRWGRGTHVGIWRTVEGDVPTCRHCLYPTRADLEAAR